MALESHVASAEDFLIQGLDFRISPGTSQYVVDKRSVTMQPQSGNYFSSQGLRLIRFTLAGTTDWLIPDSLRLSFVVNNLDTADPIQPVTIYPGSIFQRLRVLSGGSAIEDINQYARLQETLGILDSPGKQQLDASEGFGYLMGGATTVDNRLVPEPIPAGGSRRVTCSLLSGLLNQPKWLPLSFAPLTLELEIGGSY